MSEPIITKRCYKCKIEKPLSEFHKDRTKPDGHERRCRICARLYRRTPSARSAQERYRKSEKGKTCQKRFKNTEKGRIAARRYGKSESNKNNQKHYYKSEKGKLARKRYRCSHQLEICTRACVQSRVECGTLPRPDTLICVCGKPAKEYHHPNGYNKEHRFDIVGLCMDCHKSIRHN